MFPYLEKPTNQQGFEIFKQWRALATHYIQVFLSELERRLLKLNAHISRRILKIKTKVNMN